MPTQDPGKFFRRGRAFLRCPRAAANRQATHDLLYHRENLDDAVATYVQQMKAPASVTCSAIVRLALRLRLRCF